MNVHVDSSTPIVHLIEEAPEVAETMRSTRAAGYPLRYPYLNLRDDDFRDAPAFYRLRWNRPLDSPRAVRVIEIVYHPEGRTNWEERERERLILCDTGTIESYTIPYSRNLNPNIRGSVITVRILPAIDTTHLWNHGESWHYEIGDPSQLVFGELPPTAIEQPWLEQGN